MSETDPTRDVAPRPHRKLTEDGRRMREVLSYTRRGSRLTPSQQRAWDAHHEAWFIPEVAVDEPDFTWSSWFGREAPLIIEIGPGVGEATGVLAATRPEANVVALEVWLPGVAAGLGEVAQAGAENVRFCTVDAAWCLEHTVGTASVEEVWTFFPDPWPKTKHHKRRLIDADFARLVADRLRPGGRWRLATDWAPYAEQMRTVLDAEPDLTGGPAPRWADRPVTKFERKGVAVGRDIADFTYTRR